MPDALLREALDDLGDYLAARSFPAYYPLDRDAHRMLVRIHEAALAATPPASAQAAYYWIGNRGVANGGNVPQPCPCEDCPWTLNATPPASAEPDTQYASDQPTEYWPPERDDD